MSNDINTVIKEDIVEEVASMSVDGFCNLCEEHHIKDIVPNIDDVINILSEKIFEDRYDSAGGGNNTLAEEISENRGDEYE